MEWWRIVGCTAGLLMALYGAWQLLWSYALEREASKRSDDEA